MLGQFRCVDPRFILRWSWCRRRSFFSSCSLYSLVYPPILPAGLVYVTFKHFADKHALLLVAEPLRPAQQLSREARPMILPARPPARPPALAGRPRVAA